MNRRRFVTIIQNAALLLGSLIISFLVIETGFRLLDPFPYFSPSEINNTEHGNLSMYDSRLGWKGVPNGKARFVTPNNSVWLEHNRQGFRDIEHDFLTEDKPAIVFLGDSFTWGYEVEFEEMFVNLLRDRFPRYEIFNLGHRGYGTDQALLTFQQWNDKRELELVLLMFYANDLLDNISEIRYQKPKPLFQIVDDDLKLTGVPVPRLQAWAAPLPPPTQTWKEPLKRLIFKSHFLHDVHFRYRSFSNRKNTATQTGTEQASQGGRTSTDLTLTSRLLEELRDNVASRGSKLIVAFIPHKAEINEIGEDPPYQIKIAEICERLGIEHVDLAPMFKSTWLRTYYRLGGHWNSHGHEVAARALQDYLKEALE